MVICAMHCLETPYGFEFGPAKVIRACSDSKRGWVMMCLETKKHKNNTFQIYVAKGGKIRIFDKNGEWAPKIKP